MPTIITFLEGFKFAISILCAMGISMGVIGIIIGLSTSSTEDTFGDIIGYSVFGSTGLTFLSEGLIMLVLLIVISIISKNYKNQYAKEEISSGYKIYVDGIESEGPVDMENYNHYTVSSNEKIIIITTQ